jgi:hypothetical protein
MVRYARERLQGVPAFSRPRGVMNRRAADRGLRSLAVQTASETGRAVHDWLDKRKIAAHAVMSVTIWLTIRIAEWAIDLPAAMAEYKYSGTDIAAMQAAVLTPWGLMQGAMLKFYLDLIRKNGHADPS